jgi:SAM-dependent MidA family methyltransferase
VEGPASDRRLEPYLEQYAPGLAEGQRIEVNLAALEQLERIAAALDHGYVLTIDYGYTAEEIAGGRRFPRGSLMSYHKHQVFDDVLADPGGRDITAHVNFTALERRGEELGLASQGLRTQAQFLMEVGEPDQFAAALEAAALEAATEQESLRLRMQLKTLLFGLGETFQVLVQKKGW